MIGVLLLAGLQGVLVLALHIEHDRDDLGARLVLLAEHVVALAATDDLVVLVELGVRERHHAHLVELHLAVLFERLADELDREARALAAHALDLVVLLADGLVFVAQLLGHRLLEGGLDLIALELGRRELSLERHDLLALLAHSLGDGEVALGVEGLLAGLRRGLELRDAAVALGNLGGGARLGGGERGRGGRLGAGKRRLGVGELLRRGGLDGGLRSLELRLQAGDKGVLAGGLGLGGRAGVRQVGRGLGLGAHEVGSGLGADVGELGLRRLARAGLRGGDGAALVLLDKSDALLDVALELRVAHLLDDGRVLGLVDSEGLPAVGALDLGHDSPSVCFAAFKSTRRLGQQFARLAARRRT